MKKKMITHKNVLREPRTDGWTNFLTLMGTSADKRTASQISWDDHGPEFYEQLYAGGGIPARIVDIIPEESLREWLDFTDVDKKSGEVYHDRCEELDVRTSISKSWKWGRAYGGACLHIVTDTKDPASPLEVGENVIGLRDLSRWDLRILTTDIEFDFASPNWGHPRLYYLNVQMGSQYKGYPIHWTRMIRFDGQLVPRRTYIRNNYWHDSVLNRLYNSIRNYETANDSAAAALMDFSVDVYKMKNLAQYIGAGKEQLVKNRLEMMSLSKSVLNAMMIDSDTEEYENMSRSLEGVADLLDHQANRLVADTDIPHTKLLGESPDGSNATGNSTSQLWNNFIAAEQKNYLRPKLKRLFSVIFPDKDNIGFKFKPLRVLDDTEIADLRLKVAQTDDIYMNHNVADPTEIAKSRWGGDDYSMETKLDWESRENGSLIPGENEPSNGGGEDGEGSDSSDSSPDDFAGEANPEGKSKVAASPSEKLEGGKEPAGENDDLTGRPKKKPKKDAEGEFGMDPENPGTQFDLKNAEIKMNGPTVPKVKSFIGQTESLPMRDPKTEPQLKGPGIPNKARTFLPTRGNGVTSESGFDFEKDAGVTGVAREGLHADSGVAATMKEFAKGTLKSSSGKPVTDPKQAAAIGYSEEKKDAPERHRAATVIVRKGDEFLMGKTRKDGRWTLPGGHVDGNESMHQGGVRELMEETGISAKKLKFLGTRLVEPQQGKTVEVAIYEVQMPDGVKPTSKNDPDKEVSSWKWHSSKSLDSEVLANLKHPNNVALDHMGLLK